MKLRLASIRMLLAVASLITLTGCAHNIQITPDLAKLRQVESNPAIDVNVAYYISPENKIKQVITPGGGGDKVTYKPYAETESALNTVLSKVFKRVYSINSINDKEFITEKNISFIFVPEITTNSSSSSLFTWPPTEFTMTLTCKAISAEGKLVWEKVLHSKGNAEFSEFSSDLSLAARRASENLFKDLLIELSNNQQTFNK